MSFGVPLLGGFSRLFSPRLLCLPSCHSSPRREFTGTTRLALVTRVSAFLPRAHRLNLIILAEAHLPQPTPDPLVFALCRLAILVLPLTSAAPTSLVDALEMSGNLQGRALGAALFAGLILAAKLS